MPTHISQEPHILSAFDRDLERAQALIMKMGGLAEEAILDAVRSLDRRDEELAQRVRMNDKTIDELEDRVHQEAARILALRSPAASDLRTILSVLKISGNLERIGDYAKNVGKRTTLLVHLPAIEDASGAIRRMGKAVEIMLRDALDAYIRRDADLAHDVRLRDQEIDQMYNALFRELLTFMMEDPRNITVCMHLHFIAKNIERIGDLVTSIAEQVIYLVTGEYPEGTRPKKNNAAYELDAQPEAPSVLDQPD